MDLLSFLILSLNQSWICLLCDAWGGRCIFQIAYMQIDKLFSLFLVCTA